MRFKQLVLFVNIKGSVQLACYYDHAIQYLRERFPPLTLILKSTQDSPNSLISKLAKAGKSVVLFGDNDSEWVERNLVEHLRWTQTQFVRTGSGFDFHKQLKDLTAELKLYYSRVVIDKDERTRRSRLSFYPPFSQFLLGSAEQHCQERQRVKALPRSTSGKSCFCKKDEGFQLVQSVRNFLRPRRSRKRAESVRMARQLRPEFEEQLRKRMFNRISQVSKAYVGR